MQPLTIEEIQKFKATGVHVSVSIVTSSYHAVGFEGMPIGNNQKANRTTRQLLPEDGIQQRKIQEAEGRKVRLTQGYAIIVNDCPDIPSHSQP